MRTRSLSPSGRNVKGRRARRRGNDTNELRTDEFCPFRADGGEFEPRFHRLGAFQEPVGELFLDALVGARKAPDPDTRLSRATAKTPFAARSTSESDNALDGVDKVHHTLPRGGEAPSGKRDLRGPRSSRLHSGIRTGRFESMVPDRRAVSMDGARASMSRTETKTKQKSGSRPK